MLTLNWYAQTLRYAAHANAEKPFTIGLTLANVFVKNASANLLRRRCGQPLLNTVCSTLMIESPWRFPAVKTA
jgi:hypothetical protein